MVKSNSLKLLDLQKRFRDYYEANLKEKFAALEAKRLNYNRTFWVRLLAWTLFDIALIYDFAHHCHIAFVPALLIGTTAMYAADVKFKQKADYKIFVFMSLMIFLYLAFFPYDIFSVSELYSKFLSGIISVYVIFHTHIAAPIVNYNGDTKHKVQQKIINFFGDFKYRNKYTLPEETLKDSQLFSSFHTQEGDDYFQGTYQGVNITVSEENLITGHGKNRHSVFNGIIIELSMNKSFSGQTIVRKNSIFNIFSPRRKLSNVTLENIKFNKMFQIKSTDQVEARYLLTTVFMENIIKLKEMYHGKKIELSFFGNRLLISISTSKDMFETTSLFRSALGYGMMGEVVRQFFYIFEIIEVLQLNQKVLQ